MWKDKKILAIVVVIVLLLLSGAYFLIAGRNTSDETAADDEPLVDQNVATLKPEEVGLTMEALNNNKQVKFTIAKPDGITAVEYELTYTAADEQQRGVIGQIEDLQVGSQIESKPLDLGSCSSGVCKYDTGVKSVDLLLKVTKSGKVYQVKDSLSLE